MIEMIATGRVVNPSAIRMTSNGSPIANFSLAVDAGRVTRWVQCTLVNYNTVDELEDDLNAITGNIITVRGRPDSQGYIDSGGEVRSKLVCWVASIEFATAGAPARRGSKLVGTAPSASHSPAPVSAPVSESVTSYTDDADLDFDNIPAASSRRRA